MVVDVTDRVAKGLRIAGPVGTGDPLTVHSPWDGGEVATINTTRLDEVDLVLDRAVAAFGEWRWTPAWKRAQILERTSHLLEDHAEEVARLIALEGGKPLKDARVEARRGASTFRWASEEAKRTAGEIIEMDADQGGENRFGWTIREPRGVIVAISPFNFPLNLVSHKVAPALAGGQRRGAQAGLLHAAHRAAPGRVPDRGRPARERAPGRGRSGLDPGHQAGQGRAREHGDLHRQPAGRPPDRQRRRHEDGHPRARQQLGDHRRRGRRPRPRAAARGRRRLLRTPVRSASRCSASSCTRRSTTSSWRRSWPRSKRSRWATRSTRRPTWRR